MTFVVDWVLKTNDLSMTVFHGAQISVELRQMQQEEEAPPEEEEDTTCEVCGHSDREDRLLLCDGCDLA